MMPIAIHDKDFRRAADMMHAPFAQLADAIANAIAEERERCAKVVEQYPCSTGNLKALADQIRGTYPEGTP